MAHKNPPMKAVGLTAKPAQPKAAAGAAAQEGPRGPDTPPLLGIQIAVGDVVEFDFFVYQTPGNLSVALDLGDANGAQTGSATLFDGLAGPVNNIHVPQLAAGTHHLDWLFQPTSVPWQAVAEITVNGALKLRETSSDPDTLVNSFLILDVA